MKLSDLRVGTRLYLGFGAIVALLIFLIAIAYSSFASLRQANAINIHTYEVIHEVDAILESLVNIETGQRGFALTGNEASLEPYNAGKVAFDQHLDKARSLTADNPAQQARLQKLESEQRQWLAAAIDPAIQLRRDINNGKTDMAGAIVWEQAGKGKQGMDAMRVMISEISSTESRLLEERTKDATIREAQTVMTLIGGGVGSAIMAVLLAIWLARNITRPLQSAIDLAQKVAQGDLTMHIEVTSKDEVGMLLAALKDMNAGLVKIVSQVRNGTDTIASASNQIASGNMDLSSRTEEQASSLEETASSMEELTSTVKQNADNARQANTLAQSAAEVATRGGTVVSQVVETMGSINDSSKKIVDIIGVIDGIAFQTNILALNAAVEAARAGEQGRGFAVVAAEVRTLAQRSAAAAKEIKELISNSVEKVDTGAKLVDQAGATMHEILDSIRRVTDIMGEISAASTEQTAGIEQINQAISQMDEATQQNASLVEEAAAASASLQDQARQLSQVVSVFNVGQTARPATAIQTKPATQARTSLQAVAPKRAITKHATPNIPALQPQRPVLDKNDWEEF